MDNVGSITGAKEGEWFAGMSWDTVPLTTAA